MVDPVAMRITTSGPRASGTPAQVGVTKTIPCFCVYAYLLWCFSMKRFGRRMLKQLRDIVFRLLRGNDLGGWSLDLA